MRSPETQIREALRDLADEVPQFRDVPTRLEGRVRRRIAVTAGSALLPVVLAIAVVVAGLRWSAKEPRPADSPTPSASPTLAGGSTRFVSPLFGYAIAVEEDWTMAPARTAWVWGEPLHGDVLTVNGTISDTSGYSFDIVVASIAITEDAATEQWRRAPETVLAGTTPCGTGLTIDPIEIDGVSGRLARACDDDLLVTVAVAGRGYAIATAGPAFLHLDDFRRALGTIDLLPEQAVSLPAAGWRGIWPQTTREDAQDAQAATMASGPESSWQVDWYQEGLVAIRFAREVLGWADARYIGNDYVPGNAMNQWDAEVTGWYLVRCARDQVNPWYPDSPTWGDCAPTIDGAHYEQVVVRTEQLIRQGRDGISIVTGWEDVQAYEQARPPSEGDARDLIERFLQARVDGAGAEAFLPEFGGGPPLYDHDGSPFVRYEIVNTARPEWPIGTRCVDVRLTAQDGTTVRETLGISLENVRDDTVGWCPYGYEGM